MPNFDYTGFARFIALSRAIEELAEERRMFHWELTFPGVFDNWQPRAGGFDAIIGNPPWERVKLQEVEWVRLRNPTAGHRHRRAGIPPPDDDRPTGGRRRPPAFRLR